MSFPLVSLIRFALLGAAALSINATAQQYCNKSIPSTAPDSRYTLHSNATVTDHETKLMWKHCSEGRVGSDCSQGKFLGFRWKEALKQAQIANAEKFGGHSDWRLPTIVELESLIERQCFNPSLNQLMLRTSFSAWAWSSTKSPTRPEFDVMAVHFGRGETKPLPHQFESYVRLVRTIK